MCFPSTQATVEWFTKYKVPAGKPKNKFAFDGKAMDRVSGVVCSVCNSVLIVLLYGMVFI